jgi:hypothetical protein
MRPIYNTGTAPAARAVPSILRTTFAPVFPAFIGGIVGVIEACRATTIVPMDIAINVAKILFSGLVGQFTFLFCTLIGKAFLEN